MRVTAGGLVPPRQVLVATYVAFGVAVLAGVYLIAIAGWQLLLVGAASILAGVLYTGGPRPYGYEGLGEVFVFLFFGVVAVAGSYFVQIEELSWEAFVLAVPVGLLAVGDPGRQQRARPRDRPARRQAHARRAARARRARAALYAAMVYVAFLTAPVPWLLGRRRPVRRGCCCRGWRSRSRCRSCGSCATRTDGPSLNGALARTGMLQLVFCVLLSAGLLAS